VKARNRTFVSKKNNPNGTTPESRRRLFSEIEEDANSNLENIDPNDPETMPAAGKQTVEKSSVLEEKITLLTKENKRLQVENEQYNIQVVQLKEEIKHEQNKMSFSVENFKHDDKLIRFYSGLQDYATFKALFDSLGKAVNHLIYYGSNTNPDNLTFSDAMKHGPKRSFSPEQEFFLVLARLRLGLLEEDLAVRAGISQTYMSRIIITWLDFLHSRFRSIPIWPSRSSVDQNMPTAFKEMYPSTRVIIDCTEIFLETPSSFRSQSATYSNYKHHNTAKGLVGISPSGAVSFVSDLYAGRSSDKQITLDCGILNLLEEGDSVMADKGFEIEGDMPLGVSLNIPPFLREKDHLSIDEETETRRIASVRIHVERAISRIKTFKILKSIYPITLSSDLNKIWVVCSYLTNFLPPLINNPE
jgi:hypothetical protein